MRGRKKMDWEQQFIIVFGLMLMSAVPYWLKTWEGIRKDLLDKWHNGVASIHDN